MSLIFKCLDALPGATAGQAAASDRCVPSQTAGVLNFMIDSEWLLTKSYLRMRYSSRARRLGVGTGRNRVSVSLRAPLL